jgi:hypothetical protein
MSSSLSTKQGVRLGRDFTLKFNQKSYVNAGIFLADIRTVCLPYIDTLRGLAIFAEAVAVLLMTHCSADVSDDVIRILTEASGRVITFAPHTTQVFQVLDFTLFGVLKRCSSFELPLDDLNATVEFRMKVYHDFTQTMVPPNIWGAFCALGPEFDMTREPYRFLFDEGKMRGSADFEELSSVDFRLDRLSGRRPTARFRWIHNPE